MWGSWKLRGREFDAIFVYAVSPIMSAIFALIIGSGRIKYLLFWVLDLWPETLKAVGVSAYRALAGISWQGCFLDIQQSQTICFGSVAASSQKSRRSFISVGVRRMVFLFCFRSPLLDPDPQVFTVLFAELR